MIRTPIKFKYLTLDELIISIDRLSRFKLPDESYNRVFTSIISKCLITPKYSKKEIENLPEKDFSKIVKEIWNKSVEKIFGKQKKQNNILKILAVSSFKNLDERTKTLINTPLAIDCVLSSLDYETSPINLKFLIKTSKLNNLNDIKNERERNKLLFPVRKLVIVEGITEEILLPVFAKKLNKNFNQNGIYILGAGGKSKSPSLYMKLRDKVKIPIILLFDNDAKEICAILKDNLLPKDKMIIIDNGEFEDILSLNLIKRALNNEYEPATPLLIEELRIHNRMCDNIEDFYRTRHLGEFKKSKLSKIIANNIKYDTDITTEIKDIIYKITTLN